MKCTYPIRVASSSNTAASRRGDPVRFVVTLERRNQLESPTMYLDPGSAGLLVQAIFAAVAAGLAMFRRTRDMTSYYFSRLMSGLRNLRRRPPTP